MPDRAAVELLYVATRENPCEEFQGDGRFCEECQWIEAMHSATTWAVWRGWVQT